MIEDFNALPREQAEERLYSCLANRQWAERVASGRPYRDLDLVFDVADIALSELTDDELLAAFKAHPRIGERGGHSPATSNREQSRVMKASNETLAALADENQRYESKFDHVFLIAAAGRSADDILKELRHRMNNDPATELQVAAAEQRKITRLRLANLLS